MDTQTVYVNIEKINRRLTDNGYSHRVGYHKINDNLFELFFKDENNTHFKEFGSFTVPQAEKFLDGFYFGLQIGLLDKPIE